MLCGLNFCKSSACIFSQVIRAPSFVGFGEQADQPRPRLSSGGESCHIFCGGSGQLALTLVSMKTCFLFLWVEGGGGVFGDSVGMCGIIL